VSTTSIKRKTYQIKKRKRKEEKERKKKETLRKLHLFHFLSSNDKQ
jgi:hypothetical protein